MPWDPQYVIESLSDSTIYMAYYSVAHILQGGQIDGSTEASGITAGQMTNDVWDWIFAPSKSKLLISAVELSKSSGIPVDLLEAMQREFRNWYPMDLCASGKDLVPNHLTFSIYNHVALFDEEFWPKGFRANGLLLLNSEKMSNSTGNFMTFRDAIETFGADATRFALADAGDSLEDANFLVDTANMAILLLYNLIEFCNESIKDLNKSRKDECNLNCFADKVF